MAAVSLAPRPCRNVSSGGSAPAKPFFVTTPIYYVNGSPHIGHLYSSVLADIITRAAALRGEAVVLSTGTDEHGLKVQQSALAAVGSAATTSVVGSPHASNTLERNAICQAYCDGVSLEYRDMHDAFNIQYSRFVRTTDESHKRVVRWLWRRLVARGAIYMGKYAGYYCQSDESFLTDAQLVPRHVYYERRGLDLPSKWVGHGEESVSAESGHSVEWVEEENYCFRLSAYQQPLLDALDRSPGSVHPPSRCREVTAFLQGGVTELSVSRRASKVEWAVPVPGDSQHSIYVWLDALANYLTAALHPAVRDNREAEISDDADPLEVFPSWPADVHVVGKDILRFHAVYWPAFLLAAGLPLPHKLVAHGHWTVGKQKMSKSLGNVINPTDLVKPRGKYTVDAIRYFLAREGGLSNDGDFSEALLHHRCTAECADSFGNLASRVLNPAFFNKEGRLLAADVNIPWETLLTVSSGAAGDVTASKDTSAEPGVPSGSILPLHHSTLLFTPEEAAFAQTLMSVQTDTLPMYQQCDISGALDRTMGVIATANRLFSSGEPWKLKPNGNKDAALSLSDKRAREVRLTSIIYLMLETLRVCGTLFWPVMPSASTTLLKCLGQAAPSATCGDVPKGRLAFGAVAPADYRVDFTTPAILFPKK